MQAAKLALFTLSGMLLLSAEALPPARNWKLTSEKVVEGNPPAFSIGIVQHLDGSGPSRRAHFDRPIPDGVIGHNRMSTALSSDG